VGKLPVDQGEKTEVEENLKKIALEAADKYYKEGKTVLAAAYHLSISDINGAYDKLKR
jgi:hypothetical protein